MINLTGPLSILQAPYFYSFPNILLLGFVEVLFIAIFVEYSSRRMGLTRLELIRRFNRRTSLLTTKILNGVSEDTKKMYSNNYIDSFLINFVYGFALALFGGWTIYITNIIYRTTINESLFLLVIFFFIELRLLFYTDAIRDPDHLTSWRSLPTVGIIAATPVVFLYVLARKRKLNLFSIEGILNVWATTRYNILNPRWLRSCEDSKIIIGGSQEKTTNPFSKRASWIHRWLNGAFQ